MNARNKEENTNPPEDGSPADRHVLTVTAPGGPRRRAGLSFGPVPRNLTVDELGDDPKKTIELLQADPMLKLGGKILPSD